MGRIKSALEIALERTESVKTDKASIGLFEARQQGKKTANNYLSDISIDLEAEVKKIPKEQHESFKQGIFDVLSTQILLPVSNEDIGKLEAVGKGLQLLIDDKNFPALYGQLIQFMSQYLSETAQYEQAVRQQYAPKLRQKEEELSRRLGREVRLDPFQDPEFINFYNQNLNMLKGNYQVAIEQVKGQLSEMWNEKT